MTRRPAEFGLATGMLAGCASYVLPPATDEIPAREKPGFAESASIAVVSTGNPVEDGCLLQALSQSGWFRVTGMAHDMVGPTLLAQVEKPIPQYQWLTFIASFTFGIVPEPLGEVHGFVFSFRRPGVAARKVVIDAQYESITWVGWVPAVRNVLPGYSSDEPEPTERFRRWLLSLVRARDAEIRTLLEAGTTERTDG